MESASTIENSILLGVNPGHFAGLIAKMTFPTTWWVVPLGKEISSVGSSTLSHSCCIFSSVLVNRILRPIKRVIVGGFLADKRSPLSTLEGGNSSVSVGS